jgi:predicted nucleic-acid-binding protein
MIKAVDTCIIARWLMRDDPIQTATADAIMDGPIEITHTVLLELGWLMTSAGRMTRDQFAETALQLLTIEQAVIERRAALRWAIERYRAGADWADMIHVATVEAAKVFATFEKKLDRRAGAGSPIPVEVLSG